MGNALFIVWRETVEALLVVGILHAWLKAREERTGQQWLWAGTAGGLILSALLAWGLLALQSVMEGETLEYVQAVLVLIASVLILHMVLWMRRHGRTLKRELEVGLGRAANGFAIALLAMITIGREGAETVIFLYGLGMADNLAALAVAVAGGVVSATFTVWLLNRGAVRIGWKAFFSVSGLLLLLLGGQLLVTGVEQLAGFGVLPTGPDPLWDSSDWLDDHTGLGGLLATFAGYRAQPAGLTVAMLACYWAFAVLGLRRTRV